MANILAIQEKVIRLILQEHPRLARVGASSFLQEAQRDGLNWNDAVLMAFLEETVRTRFGVVITKKNIKKTMNGSSSTVGDLAIAIFLAMERQQKTGSLFGAQVSTAA